MTRLLAAVALLAPLSLPAATCAPYSGPSVAAMSHLEGLMHEHSSYSDGDPKSIPADYFRIAKTAGYSFVGASEHSDSYDQGVFIGLHESCFTTPDGFLTCFANPSDDKLQKWNATAQQVAAAQSPSFLPIRGFEWTSDVFGHINVYFGQNFTNAKTDGGFATTLDTFWAWFARDPNTPGAGGSATSPVPFGGGSDSLGHFNHPGEKCQTANIPGNTQCDWNDYQLVPAAVERMFGIETYNPSNGNDKYHARIAKALDKGWRLSFIGVEDEHDGRYASESSAKTVTITTAATEAAFREAWLARRTYSLSPGQHLRAQLSADGHPMGAQMSCTTGQPLHIDVDVRHRDGSPFVGDLRLYSNGGVEVARIPAGAGRFTVPVQAGKRWYYVRAHSPNGQSAAYLAPVWVTGGASNGQWLKGDMHVHTDHSSDGSAPRQSADDRGPGNVSVADQIAQGVSNGAQWLPITDHRTYDQHYDPLWESNQLLLIPGEEGNGSPHVTIHGAVDMIDQANAPAGSPDWRSVQQALWAAHAQGAIYVQAHPDDGVMDLNGVVNSRGSVLGFDSVEAWNRASDVEREMDYAETRWNRGYRFGINGASDSHFREIWAAVGPGMPGTDVFAPNYSERGILQGLQAGRTRIALRSTDPQVTLMADADNDGQFEALQGDELVVAPGTVVRLAVRVINGVGTTVNLYQAPGRIAAPPAQSWMPLATDQTFTHLYTATSDHSWFRVEVRGPGDAAGVDTTAIGRFDFAAILAGSNASDALRAITSPIFVGPQLAVPQGEQPLPADAGGDDGARTVLGDALTFAGFADVAESDGVVHVVGEQHGAGSTQVWYRHQAADGVLSPTVLISTASTTARFAKVAAQGNTVWVVWQDERGGQKPRRKAIYARQSTDGGNSWEPEQHIATPAGRAEHPDLVLTPQGEPVIVWQQIGAGQAFDVWGVVLGRDAAPINLSGTGKVVAAANPSDTRSARYPASVWPSVAVHSNGEIAVAWQDNRTDPDPLFTGAAGTGEGTAPDNWQLMVSRRNGMLWGTPVSVGSNSLVERHPTLAYDPSGQLWLAWDSKPMSSAGPHLEVWAASAPPTGNFGAPMRMSPEGVFAQRPQLGANAQGLTLAWFDNGSNDWRWRVAYRQLTAPGQWQAAQRLPSVGVNTWPASSGGWLAFSSTRHATRLQRDPTQHIVLKALPGPSLRLSLVERFNVPPNSFITSERITLPPFFGSLAVRLEGDLQISINQAPFTNTPPALRPGDRIAVRHVSAATLGQTKTQRLFLGDVAIPFITTTTTEDRIPDAFDFGQKVGQQGGAWSESARVVPVGFTHASPIQPGPGVEYRVDGGSWAASTGTLEPGQGIQLRHKANTQGLGYTKSYLRIGGVAGYYVSRTAQRG